MLATAPKRAHCSDNGNPAASPKLPVVLAHGLTDYALQTPSIAAFWALLLGLQFAFGAQGD